jgi:hypothetical protein
VNAKFLALIDAQGHTVFIAKQHIVSVRIAGKTAITVEVGCVNGHWYAQQYTTVDAACAALDEIMVELEDFS